jgi:ABC-2 type transport system ATP-binding protein
LTDAALVIDVKNLTKSFSGKLAVDSLSLKVEAGEIFGFLGPNGSGKTTFIRMLCGLLRPDSGSGVCLGFDLLTEAWKIKPRIGYMAQHFSLYEDLSVRENLDFTARVYGVQDRQQAVTEIIKDMALEPYVSQLAGNLSGGWKQRLALASCLLHKPQLLLLDEPTAGVDPKARRDFWDDIYGLAAQGISTLISTHYMDEAERCHRVAYLAYGELLAAGTAEELITEAALTTWAATGPRTHDLAARIKAIDGVEMVVPFGNTLHICGRDADLLAKRLQPFRDAGGYHWEKVTTGLEEVFISLMQGRMEERDVG